MANFTVGDPPELTGVAQVDIDNIREYLLELSEELEFLFRNIQMCEE